MMKKGILFSLFSLLSLHTSWSLATPDDSASVQDITAAIEGICPSPSTTIITGSANQSCSASQGLELDQTPLTSPFRSAAPAAKPATTGLWTYTPVCIKRTVPSWPHSETDLCVYTSTTFNGRGMSIITTPATAKIVAEEHSFGFNSGSKISGDTADDSSLFVHRPHETHDEQRSIRARRAIESRERLFVDSPVLVLHEDIRGLSDSDKERILQTAVSQLPAAAQQLVLDMMPGSPAHQEKDNKNGTIPEILPLLSTHAGLSMELGSVRHYMLMPFLGYTQHSCAPNSYSSSDPTTISVTFRAARKIQAGEDVTTTYLAEHPQPHFYGFQARQDFIQENLRFNCTCERCQLGESADEALNMLLDHQKIVERRLSQGLMVDESEALKLVDLYKACRFDVFLDFAYVSVAEAYQSLGMTSAARKYARMLKDVLSWNGVSLDMARYRI